MMIKKTCMYCSKMFTTRHISPLHVIVSIIQNFINVEAYNGTAYINVEGKKYFKANKKIFVPRFGSIICLFCTHNLSQRKKINVNDLVMYLFTQVIAT